MSTNLIPFDASGALPAHLAPFAADAGNEFGFSGATFPTISIKGKVFTIVRGKEKTLVTKPGSEDGEPAAALEVVILNVGPKAGFAKTYYETGYVEGSVSKPDCESDDGVAPKVGVVSPQAKKCALCPQNAAGSGATAQNPKAKACRSSKVLAVAPAGQLTDSMMIRVPGASTPKLTEYGQFLANRGVKAAAVVTRIGFDYSVAHPALTFKATGFVTPEMVPVITEQRDSNLVRTMIGEAPVIDEEGDTLPADVPAHAVETPPATVATKAPPKKAAPPVVAEDPPPPAVTQKAPPKKAPVTVAADDDAGLDAALDSLDFDD